jgi:SAM-dependent methyltransferase
VATTAFNPVAYKQTTREQWQEAAEAWHRWGPTLEQWLGPATEVMLDQANIGTGARVLDLAAGAGGQAIAAARRVGPSGYVLATDISPAILAYAADTVRAAGLENVETREMDGEALDVDDGMFDAVISRVGPIYFPDRQRALREIHRVLRPGGRISAIVYRRRSATRSSRFPSESSVGSPACRRPHPACPGRSASAARASSRRPTQTPDSRMSTYVRWTRRSASPPRPSASASNASRSARSMPCSPASPRRNANGPGRRSRRSSDGSKIPTDSKGPVSSSSAAPVAAPDRTETPGAGVGPRSARPVGDEILRPMRSRRRSFKTDSQWLRVALAAAGLGVTLILASRAAWAPNVLVYIGVVIGLVGVYIAIAVLVLPLPLPPLLADRRTRVINRRLDAFLVEGHALNARHVTDAEGLAGLEAHYADWSTQAQTWLAKNASPAEAAAFEHATGRSADILDSFDPAHNRLRLKLSWQLDVLHVLRTRDA